MPSKELIVVAGPNGAGKSTFVAGYLSERACPYLCADLIATEFQHLEPMARQIAAGREFLLRSEQHLINGDNFIVETTISGRSLRNFLERAKVAQFSITIFFIYLNSADTCVARVRQRVRRGGHNVPEEDIRRRFTRSLPNFWQIYRKIADYWYIVYNSSGEYEWIASGDIVAFLVHQRDEFQQFLQLAGVDNVEADN